MEQERADVVRAHGGVGCASKACLTQPYLVFIDETATSTNMVRLRGRCPAWGAIN